MGALHAGHLSLVERSQSRCDHTVVSIFVNPTQFGPHEDFAKYPRTEDTDLDDCAQKNVDAVFMPDRGTIYGGPEVRVHVPNLATHLEGEVRPGHFDGVAQVVSILFNLVQPDVAVFGLKDLQQCAVIRSLVQGLHFPIELDFAPTYREPDGLAMSSRNRYLSFKERETAAYLSATLQACLIQLQSGRDWLEIRRAATQFLETYGLTVDYLDRVDPYTMRPVQDPHPFRLVVAVRLGSVRLLDNMGHEDQEIDQRLAELLPKTSEVLGIFR